jgi:hypothetical protein
MSVFLNLEINQRAQKAFGSFYIYFFVKFNHSDGRIGISYYYFRATWLIILKMKLKCTKEKSKIKIKS